MWRALDGLPRYIVTRRVSNQASAVRLARRTRLPRQCDDRNRPRRRRDVRCPAQPLSRGVIVADRNEPRRPPPLHADNYADDARAAAIAEAARRLVELRDRWLNPPEWVEWVDAPVRGYPQVLRLKFLLRWLKGVRLNSGISGMSAT